MVTPPSGSAGKYWIYLSGLTAKIGCGTNTDTGIGVETAQHFSLACKIWHSKLNWSIIISYHCGKIGKISLLLSLNLGSKCSVCSLFLQDAHSFIMKNTLPQEFQPYSNTYLIPPKREYMFSDILPLYKQFVALQWEKPSCWYFNLTAVPPLIYQSRMIRVLWSLLENLYLCNCPGITYYHHW